MNALIRTRGPREMGRAFNDIDTLLDRFFGTTPMQVEPRADVSVPALDVSETHDAFVIHADLPGVRREDIGITLNDGEITIAVTSANEREDKDETSGRLLRRERHSRRYLRSLRIGEGIDADRVAATYVDGVLTVTLPKTEAARPRRIEIGTP